MTQRITQFWDKIQRNTFHISYNCFFVRLPFAKQSSFALLMRLFLYSWVEYVFSPVSKYHWIVAFLCMTRANLYINISQECSTVGQKETRTWNTKFGFSVTGFLSFITWTKPRFVIVVKSFCPNRRTPKGITKNSAVFKRFVNLNKDECVNWLTDRPQGKP